MFSPEATQCRNYAKFPDAVFAPRQFSVAPALRRRELSRRPSAEKALSGPDNAALRCFINSGFLSTYMKIGRSAWRNAGPLEEENAFLALRHSGSSGIRRPFGKNQASSGHGSKDECPVTERQPNAVAVPRLDGESVVVFDQKDAICILSGK